MEWSTHSEKYPGLSYFVTLTYNPENLPQGGNLDKPGVLQWLKDVQKRKTAPFRYYLVGEYGADSKRPHYHLAVFTTHPAQISALRADWQSRGFTQAAEITIARAGYLANYTTKKLTKRGPDGLVPEFRTSSRYPPLGTEFVERVTAAYRTRPGRALIEKYGDVERTFRFGRKIYPFDSWALNKIREGLGIPLSEKGRRKANPTAPRRYEEWTENDPVAHQQQEQFIHVKATQGKQRGKGQKI